MAGPPPTRVIFIDNYDSFSYNIVQYLQEMGADVTVFRNDKITVEEVSALKPDKIVISPGPGTPKCSGGISIEVLEKLSGKIPILGVCLGMQSMFDAFGGKVIHAGEVVHGKTSPAIHDGKGLFRGIPSPVNVCRYHSLVGDPESMPDSLEVTARLENGLIMAVRHKEFDVRGVQFHPESIVTDHGKQMLRNFLEGTY